MIYILSQAIQTGKTTQLMKLTQGQKSIGGFLSPTVGNLRHLYNIKEDKYIEFEKSEADSTTIPVGRFHFVTSSFESASEWTLNQINVNNIDIIIIDELGKLELQNKGFHPLAEQLLSHNWTSKHLLLIIRDFLLDDLTKKYNISDYKLINLDDIQNLLTPNL